MHDIDQLYRLLDDDTPRYEQEKSVLDKCRIEGDGAVVVAMSERAVISCHQMGVGECRLVQTASYDALRELALLAHGMATVADKQEQVAAEIGHMTPEYLFGIVHALYTG